MRKLCLLMVLVLCRQTRGLTMGSSHDLDKNDYYKHDTDVKRNFFFWRFLENFGKSFSRKLLLMEAHPYINVKNI